MMHSGKQTMASAGDDQCQLRSYKDGCPGGLTPHHCVPDHCFKKPDSQGGGLYPGGLSHGDGLCVCVKGSTKSTGAAGGNVSRKNFSSDKKHFDALAEHGRIHKLFDKAEADLGKAGKPPNSAKLGELEDAAAKVISQVTGCDEKDLKKQIRAHHQSRGLAPDHKFRADPFGRKKAPPYSTMGSKTPGISGLSR
jgi:hypothetical protein